MQVHRSLTDRNQIFSFARWLLVVKKHWMENRKRYGLALLAMLGLSVTWFTFVLLMTNEHEVPVIIQFMSYFCGLFFIGALFASSTFSGLADKGEGIDFLSLPASHLEKLLCAILFSLFFFFIAFNICFYIVDIPMLKWSRHLIATQYAWQDRGTRFVDNYILNVFTGEGEPPPLRGTAALIYGFFSLQSAFILGSVYFRRYAFIKTIVAVLLLMLVGMLFVTKVVESNLPQGGWRLDGILEWVLFDKPGEPAYVRLPPWIENGLIFLMEYSLPVIFCWAAYHRLKEKEV